MSELEDEGGDNVELRVLVCGSRTFDDRGAVYTVLDGLDLETSGHVLVIHGAANGADTLAAQWATQTERAQVPYPASWEQFGKRAGYVRNAQMLAEGKPDVVWAFVDKPLNESKGTAMMVDLAAKAGVPTYVVQRACSGSTADPSPQ